MCPEELDECWAPHAGEWVHDRELSGRRIHAHGNSLGSLFEAQQRAGEPIGTSRDGRPGPVRLKLVCPADSHLNDHRRERGHDRHDDQRERIPVSSTRTRIQLYVDQENGNVLGRDDMTLDLKAVVDHYVQANLIRASDYLTSIQAGYEIVSGGAYQTSEFWTAVQGEGDGP
jgi:hypothetical protein